MWIAGPNRFSRDRRRLPDSTAISPWWMPIRTRPVELSRRCRISMAAKHARAVLSSAVPPIPNTARMPSPRGLVVPA